MLLQITAVCEECTQSIQAEILAVDADNVDASIQAVRPMLEVKLMGRVCEGIHSSSFIWGGA